MPALVVRLPRDVVVVSGPDATSFLQSLLSQDLEPVGVGGTAHALLLQPQGKLLVDLRATRVEPDVWSCDCEPGFGPVLGDGLRRFRIRVKVDVRVEAVEMLAVRGTVAAPPGVAALPAVGGFDVVGPSALIDDAVTRLALPVADADAFERWRIEAGVPRMGLDLDERTIPQEAFLDRDAVSFTKGCFVGQELVCRIDTRGHVNRLLRRVRAGAPVARGDPVTAGGKVVGEVTSAAGEVALAMLRREVAPGSAVDVRGMAARVEAI